MSDSQKAAEEILQMLIPAFGLKRLTPGTWNGLVEAIRQIIDKHCC